MTERPIQPLSKISVARAVTYHGAELFVRNKNPV
jgi:hypothetical protein